MLMKSENERLMADTEKIKQRLREEIARTMAGVRLDLNLEKGTYDRFTPGRIRDAVSYTHLTLPTICSV